ncbi:MAG: hypothetical protein HDR79_06590, partial [Bacteroides sp.]|nr:hypothetical protein [Bacteroides sp.]
MERRIPIRRNRPTQGRRKMGSVAPSPRWRGSAIDDPIKAKTVELPLHRGEGATMPGHCYGKADSDPPQAQNRGRSKMGSVAPPPRWRDSAIDGPIKAKTVEL